MLAKLLACAILSAEISQARWAFPPHFKFGVATSTYQIEGAYDEDGKGLNVWDVATNENPEIIVDGSNGNIACDSYHKWEDDIAIIKATGVNYYRFSLSWTRLLPQGFIYELNQPGVDYYNNLINGLLANGIEPIVTIYHWDLPETLSPLGQWSNPGVIKVYADFARKVFQLFGDRVKTWITFNEPQSFCVDINVFLAEITPYYPSGIIEYLFAYNVLRAHAEVYYIYKNEFKAQQKGRVSITLNIDWSAPATNSAADREAAEQRRQFEFGLFASPIFLFDYPKIVKDRIAYRSKLQGFPSSRLPQFTNEEKRKISGSFDYLGLNHYTTWLVAAAPEAPLSNLSWASDMGTTHFQDPSWIATGTPGNKVVPWGLRDTLKWIKETYRNPEILITECGYPDTTGTLDDQPRIDFFKGYLNATLQAIYQDRVDVTTFTVWSIMDNFEWNNGYTLKYGLYNVNFSDPNRTRTKKNSADYIRRVVETRLID